MQDFKKIENALENFGLSEKEISIYLEILKLGFAPASILAKITGIARSSGKFICDQLVKKGLLSETIQVNTSIYVAEAPEKLLEILELKKLELEKKRDEFNSIIPDLSLIFNPNSSLPKIKFYSSEEDIKTIFGEILNSFNPGEEIISITKALDPEKSSPDVVKSVDKFIKNRVSKKIHARVIALDLKGSKMLKKNDKANLRETRLVQINTQVEHACEIFMVKDKIYTISLDKTSFFGYVLENKVITAFQKSIFEILWNLGK